jgi:hypothetical protein
VNQDLEVEFFEIPDQQTFDSLWSSGLFKKINKKTGSLLDDYEEDVIEYLNIDKLQEAVIEFRKKKNRLDPGEAVVFVALEKLIAVAIEKRSPIFFIL